MDRPRVRVLAGSASPVELAAVVMALDAARREAAATGAAAPAPADPVPAWRRASLVEGAGRPVVATRWDLPERTW